MTTKDVIRNPTTCQIFKAKLSFNLFLPLSPYSSLKAWKFLHLSLLLFHLFHLCFSKSEISHLFCPLFMGERAREAKESMLHLSNGGVFSIHNMNG